MGLNSQQQVVLLNGPAGVGKTTVGRRLAGAVCNGICIHGDDLKNFVVVRDPDTTPSGLTYVGSAALADVYLNAGYDLVVVDFVFPRAQHIERFQRALVSNVSVSLFTLWAPLNVITAREAARTDREQLGPRVAECWNELARHRDELGQVVQALSTPDEIASRILQQLGIVQAHQRCCSGSTSFPSNSQAVAVP